MKNRKYALIGLLLSFLLLSLDSAATTLNRANSAEPETIDPHKSIGIPDGNIVRELFEGLVGEDSDGNIVPGVAKSWVISEDGLIYTFHLQDNAKWSNGDPLTANDFVYSMQRVLLPATAAPYTNFLFPIKNAEKISQRHVPLEKLGVQATAPHTLVITLEHPTPYFLSSLIHVTLFPVHEATIKKWGDGFTQPGRIISNGAYILRKWVVNGSMTLEKNPYYWNASTVKIDTVNYFPVTDGMAMVRMYQANQIDFTSTIPSNQIKALQQQLGNEVKINPFLANIFYSLNLEKSPLKDNVKLRQALNMAIDREAITNFIMGQQQKPLYALLPSTVKGATAITFPWATLNTPERNKIAQQLYQEAGFSKENPATLSILYNTTDEHKKLALAVSSMWKKVLGVNTALENQEWKVFLGSRRRGDFIIARNGWVADYNYPTTYLELFMCDNPQNYSRYCNKRYDELIQQASFSNNDLERQKFYDEAHQLLLADYPLIPLYEATEFHLIKHYVKGYTGKNPLQHTYSKNLWIEEKS